MSRLLTKLRESGEGVKALARRAKVHPAAMSSFIHDHFERLSKARRKQIRGFFVAEGWLPAPKPRPRHKCPSCESIHVIKYGRQAKHQQTPAQSETATRVPQ